MEILKKPIQRTPGETITQMLHVRDEYMLGLPLRKKILALLNPSYSLYRNVQQEPTDITLRFDLDKDGIWSDVSALMYFRDVNDNSMHLTKLLLPAKYPLRDYSTHSKRVETMEETLLASIVFCPEITEGIRAIVPKNMSDVKESKEYVTNTSELNYVSFGNLITLDTLHKMNQNFEYGLFMKPIENSSFLTNVIHPRNIKIVDTHSFLSSLVLSIIQQQNNLRFITKLPPEVAAQYGSPEQLQIKLENNIKLFIDGLNSFESKGESIRDVWSKKERNALQSLPAKIFSPNGLGNHFINRLQKGCVVRCHGDRALRNIAYSGDFTKPELISNYYPDLFVHFDPDVDRPDFHNIDVASDVAMPIADAVGREWDTERAISLDNRLSKLYLTVSNQIDDIDAINVFKTYKFEKFIVLFYILELFEQNHELAKQFLEHTKRSYIDVFSALMGR